MKFWERLKDLPHESVGQDTSSVFLYSLKVMHSLRLRRQTHINYGRRDGENVQRALGVDHAPGSVILTDGYAAYASYAKKAGIAHALCWSHSRREFVEAQTTEPTGVLKAVRRIGA